MCFTYQWLIPHKVGKQVFTPGYQCKHNFCLFAIHDKCLFSFLPCFGLSVSGFDSGQQALSGQLDHVLFSFAVIIIFYYKILYGL